MSIRLEAIKLNHDPSGAASDALTIRRNASQVVQVPEWRHGVSNNPEDSPAAYAIEETRGHTIKIQAQFSRLDPTLQNVEIRAVELPGLGSALGQVKAHTVAFPPGGGTGFETFELENVVIEPLGVGVFTTTWRWQFRRAGGAWTDFETSRHRIYVVVRAPRFSPWTQDPAGGGTDQLPWIDVLDYACRWAAQAKDVDEAAVRVTRAVNDLGPGVLTYDCFSGGRGHYTNSEEFLCTRFLELLKGVPGSIVFVNCSDCAAVVSTFANILGADLAQSTMEILLGGQFDLNPVRLIGAADWQPCETSFGRHEVAWKRPCHAEDEIFDACLQLDGDADPTASPHTPLLATNLKFGGVGDMLYRDRLVVPAHRQRCEANAVAQQRRRVQ